MTADSDILAGTLSEIEYKQLPERAASAIKEEDFLCGWTLGGNIFVWVKNPAAEKQLELEFSHCEQRFLSREERQRRLARSDDSVVEGHRVDRRYTLADDTDALTVDYLIKPGFGGEPVRESDMAFPAGLQRGLDAAMRRALEKARLPLVYATWSREERVRYWVAALYRVERNTHEHAHKAGPLAEDPHFIERASRTDPRIAELIPDIEAMLIAIVGS